jgi:hypothetical protein
MVEVETGKADESAVCTINRHLLVRQASYDRKNVGASLADARLTTAD